MKEHPITPPDELVEKWTQTDEDERFDKFYKRICTQAARWGADMELEACCEWFRSRGYHPEVYRDLLAARRKPPSLKEQALKAVQNIDDACESEGFSRSDDTDIIRRALESLPD